MCTLGIFHYYASMYTTASYKEEGEEKEKSQISKYVSCQRGVYGCITGQAAVTVHNVVRCCMQPSIDSYLFALITNLPVV